MHHGPPFFRPHRSEVFPRAIPSAGVFGSSALAERAPLYTLKAGPLFAIDSFLSEIVLLFTWAFLSAEPQRQLPSKRFPPLICGPFKGVNSPFVFANVASRPFSENTEDLSFSRAPPSQGVVDRSQESVPPPPTSRRSSQSDTEAGSRPSPPANIMKAPDLLYFNNPG